MNEPTLDTLARRPEPTAAGESRGCRSTRLWSVFLLVGIILGVQTPTFAQDTLTVGGAKLRLGMSRDDIAAQLNPDYRLEAQGDDWRIVPKKGPPFEALASMGFDERGRLVSMAKHWGSFEGVEVASLGNLLFTLLLANSPGKQTEPVLITLDRTAAGHVPLFNVVKITLGRWTISLAATQGGVFPGQGVTRAQVIVTEFLK